MDYLPKNVLKAPQDELNQLLNSVPSGSFKSLPISELPGNMGIPPTLLAKYASVDVAVYDQVVHGVRWAGIVGNRLDEDKKTGIQVFDRDAFVFGFSVSALTASPTGFLHQHGKHVDRTVPVTQVLPEAEALETIESLRELVVSTEGRVEDSPMLVEALQNALNESFLQFGKPVIDEESSGELTVVENTPPAD